MILVVCLPCAFAIRVMPVRISDMQSVQELDQLVGQRSEYWPDRYTCPLCDKPARGILERTADPRALQLMTVRDLTPQEAFAAFNGVGLPDEQKCSLETVQALLTEHPIRKVVGSNIPGSERTLIEQLELWDGSRVYFGSGGDGAVIYRVVRPSSYAAKQPEAP